MSDIKAMYRTVMADHFPPEMTITFGDQKLVYRKRTWKLPDAKGEVIEMGLRYGENPGQEAALYQLAGGNLTLGAATSWIPITASPAPSTKRPWSRRASTRARPT
jgi:phosphoribosylaminoimidazolecarboxamide formyltransferase/IMP cyclohydrolase